MKPDMNAEIKKRFEETAERYAIKHKAKYLPKNCYASEHKQGFIAGAEHGYKEAIEQAKKWIQKNVPIIHTEEGDYVRVNMGHKNIPMNIYLSNFESDMNQIPTEKKCDNCINYDRDFELCLQDGIKRVGNCKACQVFEHYKSK